MKISELMVFALNSTRELGENIASHIGVALSKHEERNFADGEHKIRSLVNVRNKDVYVIQSLYSEQHESVNDKLCRLLFFINALKDASAGKVTAVVPYLCYARKDRKTKPRDPVTTRYIAHLFEAVGTDALITIDAHNLQAFQNAFRCPTDHLEAKKLFADYFFQQNGKDNVVLMSPDIGGIKRVEEFSEILSKKLQKNVPIVFMEKYRSEETITGGSTVVGEVKNKTVIILDDLISTGGTLSRAAIACQKNGAKKIYAAATHGIFVENAAEILQEQALEKIIVANTTDCYKSIKNILRDKLVTLDVASLFAQAIMRMHRGDSVSELSN